MMADALVERRKFSRKQVKLSCHLQLASGVLVHGVTRDISQEGVGMEAQPLPGNQQNMAPKVGDMALLILQYNTQVASDSMKIRCRVMYTQANRIGLHLFYSRMTTLDKHNLDKILETGSE